MGGRVGVDHTLQRANRAVLRHTGLLDELEQAVQRSERALEGAMVDGGSDAARSPQDAAGAELGDRMAGGVAADLVDLHQLAVGRETRCELAELHPTP